MAPSIASIRIKLLDSATLQPEADNRDSSPAMQAEMLRRMDLAHNYNAWLLGRARAFLGPRVLDAGAGSGTFTDLLARDHEVVALEQDREFAALLRHRYQNYSNVAVVEGDATELDPDLAPFDAIICFNVLEHVPDDAAMLMRLRLALNPGGSVLLLTPAHPRLYGSMDRTVGHVRRYTTRDIDSLLRDAGLIPIDVRYVNPLGAVGWFVSSRVLRRSYVPTRPLRLYDRLVPILRPLDRLRLPFGLSVWARASAPSTSRTASS